MLKQKQVDEAENLGLNDLFEDYNVDSISEDIFDSDDIGIKELFEIETDSLYNEYLGN